MNAATAKATKELTATGAIATISAQTYISAMSGALVSSKHAINTELAIMLAVFYTAGNTERAAKRELMTIYSNAGYDCNTDKGGDYKTINRRINTGAELYDFIGKDKIATWTGNNTEMNFLNELIKQIGTYNLKTMQGVAILIGKPPQTRTASQATVTKAPTAEQKEAAQKTPDGSASLTRRASDKPEEAGTLFVDTEHLHVTIPPQATKEELIAAAYQMLAVANALDGDDSSAATITEARVADPIEKGDEQPAPQAAKPQLQAEGMPGAKKRTARVPKGTMATA